MFSYDVLSDIYYTNNINRIHKQSQITVNFITASGLEYFRKICYANVVTKRKDGIIMAAIKITKDNFDKEVLRSDKPVLVDFWASWCGPCRMVSPLVDEIAEECPDKKVGKVNVDEEPELASKFDVMSIPTLLIFEDGELVNRAVGARPKEMILQLFNE